MVLKQEHKAILREFGNDDRDIAEIGLALDAGEFTFTNVATGKRISEQTAFDKLGVRTFLSGISRAAFHSSCIRETKEGKEIDIRRNY
jgi:hypothetical protein